MTASASAPRDGFTVEAPTVALPSGGGSLRGLGETFTANPATGTASFSIPVPLSAGRGGFGPSLALSHDSGSGSSAYGMGWSVPIPSVTRKTDRGVPRYAEGDDPDVFVIAGAEDLVLALVEVDGAWVEDASDRDGYTVTRYRPRVEAAFTRIERWADQATGESHWQTVSRGNVASVFGRSAAARLADPDDPRRVFQWLLEETRDERGNVVAYEYKPEDLAGVETSQAHERARTRAGSRCAQVYPKRIRYGNGAPFVASDWLFEVVFDYGEHDATVPEVDEARPWPVRMDPFSRFRSGFDVRTYRLCRRILMFHRFAELGPTPCLVRSLDLTYEESGAATLLVAVTTTGYEREGGGYSSRSLPPIELGWSAPVVADELFTAAGIDNLPAGADPRDHVWVDLDAEGAPGVLARQGQGWFYKRNLGGGTLGPLEAIADVPACSRGGGYQLVDVDGDGRLELARFDAQVAGYQERTVTGWGPWRAFNAVPVLDWNDRNVRLVDVDGDGLADVLVTEDEVFRWYPSLGKGGFGEARCVPKPADEERGPALVFHDRTETVFTADMDGDGLRDLVRVQNGSICYWPNRGHGRFGARIAMGGAPCFDRPDRFDARRVRLADADGLGPADVIYLDGDGARLWLNQAGNAFGPEQRLTRFPGVDSVAWADVVDLLGDGTACLVWSSPLPTSAPPLRYLPLMGQGKPCLLTSITNNLGAETTLTYAPSTRFYLADRAAGRPWLTRLPFPVQVLEAVERRDRVTGHRFTSRYAYHHGHFDGVEREFRGFGLVEQWDTESFDDFVQADASNADPALYVPPVHTRTWFHTGACPGAESVSRQYADEYYGSAAALPDTPLPPGLSPAETREACRALKGRVLRTEVYADDGSAEAEHPYTVTESRYQIRRVQPLTAERHAAFATAPGETVSFDHERNPDDPRVTHAFTLAVDDFGNTTRAAAVGYPRRFPAHDEQGVTSITVTETAFINQVDGDAAYHLGVPYERKTWELSGLAGSFDAPLSAGGIEAALGVAVEIPFEERPGAGFTRRLLGHERTLYYADDVSGALALGELGRRALLFERQRLALSAGLVASAYGGRVTEVMLTGESAYVVSEGGFWARSGRQVPGPALFYQPVLAIDPFGSETIVGHDGYALVVDELVDPLGNTVVAEIDYRVLAPRQVTDANGNRSAVAFDELGMAAATAVMGKQGSTEGDTLEDPTRRLEYDLSAWRDRGEPTFVHVFAREQHGAANGRWQESYQYHDGAGRVVMTKAQAEPGPAPKRDADGTLVLDGDGVPVLEETARRWIGTGRTIVDNKGNPVKQYEPFFSSTPAYEDESELVEWGVTPLLHHDPLGRIVATELPNGTRRRVVFDPWQQETWDENDTVLESGWYAERSGLPATDPEGRAARLTAAHAESPLLTHLDALGRAFLTVEDNRAAGRYETRVALDIQGNRLAVTDARGVVTLTSIYALGGAPIYSRSADAGEAWTLLDVAGEPVRTWKSGDLHVRRVHDSLRRPTHVYVTEGTGVERLVERTVYGEAHVDPASLNLRGVVHQQLDGAGLVIFDEYDFKGNLVRSTRRVAANGSAALDWTSVAALTTPAEIAAAAEPLLDPEAFAHASTHDALGRRVTHTTPDGSTTRVTYNEASRLETVEVAVRRATAATPMVTAVSYNARGQRERIEYGNGAATTHAYDAETFRLTHVVTTRASDGAVLQDLRYTYDPVGNVTEIADGAQQTLFFANAVVSPNATFEYDALYRLVRATGREHASSVQVGVADPLYGAIPHPNDATAIVAYSEEYQYDGVGNVLRVAHAASSGGWTRRYAYATDSNRLLATSEPGDPAGGPYTAPYMHDDRGSMTAMPHLVSIGRDFRDQIVSADLGGGGTAHYGYDGSNQRVRKLVERLGAVTEERFYLGAYELYRRRLGSVVEEERETIHVMDDRRRIALVETATITGRTIVSSPTPRSRYQLDNHLGSALLELDETAGIISYEEYRPYGSTAYHSEAGGLVSRKRYRYTGKEKDEETGLCYHGARYYAPWLARWASADPLGPVDGPNLFAYAAGRPLVAIDPTGTSSLLLALVAAWAGGEEEPTPETPPTPARPIGTSEDPLGVGVASPSLPLHNPAPWYMSEEEEGPSVRALTPAGARAWEEQKAIERYIGANPPPLPDIIPGDPVSAQANMRWEADAYAHFGYENPNQFNVLGITMDDVTSAIGGALTSGRNVAHAATLKLTSALVNHNEYVRRFLGYEGSELEVRTPFSYGTRGAGNRIHDHYDPVGIAYEMTLQPWARMGERKLELKQNQIQADVLNLRRGYVVDARTGEQLPLREVYWVGVDPFPSSGFGARLGQQLEGAGIPYIRFVPTGLRPPTRPRIIIP